MAAAALKGPLNGDLKSSITSRRRVFVQTENGVVMGMELDGCDNAHTVKRRLQVALNVPTEETSLICGDMVLKNDLSTVRNHSPLLLTKNCLHRSSSSPCFSPSTKYAQIRDQSCPIEVIGCSSRFPGTKQLVKDIVEAMKNGIDPIPVRSGLGGAYYFRGSNGQNVAIIKPTDEEPFAPNNPKGFVGKALGLPGLKRSVRVGETGFREVAAYLLDYDGYANVPLTALVKVIHSIFNVNGDGVNGDSFLQREEISKIGSFQQFVPHDCDAGDHGTSNFPVSAVHRIGILDVRIMNTDRHAGNILIRKCNGVGEFNQVDLFPIDHGLCLPESLEDPYFEWIHWPQASIPFSEDELEYIANLDPFHDSEMLRMELPMIREACLRVLVLCTFFLKEAARFGLSVAEIGEMMSREFQRQAEEPSKLELICIEARSFLQEIRMVNLSPEGEDEFQFDLECEDYNMELNRSLGKLSFQKNCQDTGAINRSPLSRVEESTDEGREQNAAESEITDEGQEQNTADSDINSRSKPPTVNKIGSAEDQSWKHKNSMQQGRYLAVTSSANRSMNERLPASSSFVTLSDMNEEEWLAFLDKFQNLLHPAFVNHKAGRASQKLIKRLGCSCKF